MARGLERELQRIVESARRASQRSAVGVVLVFSGGYWLLSARKWFTGSKVQGTEEELKAIEAGFTRVGHTLEGID
ncbi:MAG: hypothetical protein ABSA14_06890 [Acidimicrobiales bacterium]|jgi:hypothetical protein